MHAQEERFSIWFFIGLLVFVYGVLITGAGLYELLEQIGIDGLKAMYQRVIVPPRQ